MINFADEKALLNEIKAGNQDAFKFLFDSYYPRLRGYASRFVQDEETIRDILQESFLKFWEKRLYLNNISLSSLLFAMVRNACLNYLKHLQIVEQYSLDYLEKVGGQEELYYADFNLDPEYSLLYKELQEQITLVINSLPPRCREVFLLSRLKKMKNREISEILHISSTAVEKHIAKALSYFSKHFKDKYPLDIYIAILAWILWE
ncbi:RNA polymerase sigma-70 factor [Parabacteroides sp. Marseille-P3160]|uniref:RNA polymerase sigma-70 factor n=1 Tax=Parabacteroides sp. Marseille-P3160 TaxID=1917887 RepID=UPI0009BC44DC|nr:RNA polymerase sigma-70 factor [Parabacteroides sp. Marseille-P3160]